MLGEKERVLFLSCDLFRRPLTSNEMPVIIGMATVWPAVFARKAGVDLVLNQWLVPEGVAQQPLSYSVEVVTTVMMKGVCSQHHMKNMHTLCCWSYGQVRVTCVCVCALSIYRYVSTHSPLAEHHQGHGRYAGEGTAADVADELWGLCGARPL